MSLNYGSLNSCHWLTKTNALYHDPNQPKSLSLSSVAEYFRHQELFPRIWASDHAARSARNAANGSMLRSMLALSSAAR